jgi:hypothetical protein
MQEHSERDAEKIREYLKQAFPPVDQELGRDLWPLMLRRMQTPARAVPWYDWALAASLVGAFVFFPKLALLLAYHL